MDLIAFRERHPALLNRLESVAVFLPAALIAAFTLLEKVVPLPAGFWHVLLPLLACVALACVSFAILSAPSSANRIASWGALIFVGAISLYVVIWALYGQPEEVTRALVAVAKWWSH